MALEKLKELGIGFRCGRGGLKEQRSTLVMVHGAGGSSEIWQGQIHPLDRFLNTLALDLPGHGDTPGKGKERVKEYARWLVEILEDLFNHPIFLMGHSLGGAIVQETALLNSQRIKGIMLVATGPRLPVAPIFLAGLLNDFEKTVENIMGYAYAAEADRSLVGEGIRLMKGVGQEVVYQDFLACDRFDRKDDLDKITLPCLIVCGDNDKLAPFSFSQDLHELIKNSVLRTVPAAGHMVMVENHKAFNQTVLDFVLA